MSSSDAPKSRPDIDSKGRRLLRKLQIQVEERLRRLGDVLETKATTSWVSFRSKGLRRVFAEVRAHRHDVEAFILPPVESLTEGDGLPVPSPPSQGWGWFRSKFRVTSENELAVATDLLVQSYDLRQEMSRRSSNRGSDS